MSVNERPPRANEKATREAERAMTEAECEEKQQDYCISRKSCGLAAPAGPTTRAPTPARPATVRAPTPHASPPRENTIAKSPTRTKRDGDKHAAEREKAHTKVRVAAASQAAGHRTPKPPRLWRGGEGGCRVLQCSRGRMHTCPRTAPRRRRAPRGRRRAHHHCRAPNPKTPATWQVEEGG